MDQSFFSLTHTIGLGELGLHPVKETGEAMVMKLQELGYMASPKWIQALKIWAPVEPSKDLADFKCHRL
ncbi:unnamed protein product [Haemonchus placei]|uniref:Mobile element protein n=1 Tax=Haemonchus placei TaxID=6290 RepID=A0A0N4WD78_HAEPC|nr:unnamed protein product [Haemonchus placei]